MGNVVNLDDYRNKRKKKSNECENDPNVIYVKRIDEMSDEEYKVFMRILNGEFNDDEE